MVGHKRAQRSRPLFPRAGPHTPYSWVAVNRDNVGCISGSEKVKVVNRSKRAIEFELVDAQDLGIGKLESKGVRFIPALPTSLAPRESTVIEVRSSKDQ